MVTAQAGPAAPSRPADAGHGVTGRAADRETDRAPGLARGADEIYDVLATLERPAFVVRDARGIAATNDERLLGPGIQVLAAVPPAPPERLGSPDFPRDHGVRHPYMAGAMANGIASAELVVALAGAGFLASFGAAGVLPARVDEALATIGRRVPAGAGFACNLIHSPNELAMERDVVDLCLRHQVRCVEASAFLDLTPQVVRYRLAGLSRAASGRVRAGNRLVAKISRAEVAERFLRPAPEPVVRGLLQAGLVTAEQAELARGVPVADDVTVEADSGGHTDRRPLTVLLPEIIALRDRLRRELAGSGQPWQVRVGAAGGIGTPAAAAAAFALGAAYVVTGSVNQASVEASQSPATKRLLAGAGTADCAMAPSADMFEMGVEVQVLRRGTMFASRARRLYEVYRAHDGIEAIPAAERDALESKIFQRPLDDVWADTVRFFTERDPDQIARAADSPKRRMALVFRWYLGLSSGWSIAGEPGRATDYQIWCGPAMGAFNTWAAGTYLAPVENRRVADIAAQIMRGAAFTSRVGHLRSAGVRLPARCATYIPSPPRTDAAAGL
ncbi:PfaD family polyunsaturated fatty acid/polyketide biosynthesis protein [Frankia sp. CiP1_Cm_nod2]|uniref:PfaD family polyunsaturated fatty acid/polyketide biosynthesis protein n=1 Tax=Frankia sp. CiP1_Cm_nod2 TaxID=2897161 RepID=UPI00202563B7